MLKKIRKMLKQQEGFTLVELMIVVVILGIISGIGIQQYGKVQDKARVSAHNANVKIITSAANMYLMVNDSIPANIDALVDGGFLDAVPKNPYGEGETIQDNKGTYALTVTQEGNFFKINVEPGAISE